MKTEKLMIFTKSTKNFVFLVNSFFYLFLNVKVTFEIQITLLQQNIALKISLPS